MGFVERGCLIFYFCMTLEVETLLSDVYFSSPDQDFLVFIHARKCDTGKVKNKKWWFFGCISQVQLLENVVS